VEDEQLNVKERRLFSGVFGGEGLISRPQCRDGRREIGLLRLDLLIARIGELQKSHHDVPLSFNRRIPLPVPSRTASPIESMTFSVALP
jgi:hypothetical protein